MMNTPPSMRHQLRQHGQADQPSSVFHVNHSSALHFTILVLSSVLALFAVVLRTRAGGEGDMGVDSITALKQWNNTGNDFNAGASWVQGTPPGPGDIADFPNPADPMHEPNLSAPVTIQDLNFGGLGASGYDLTSSSSSIALTLTQTGGAPGGSAISSQNLSGTNIIDAPIVMGAAAGSSQYIYQSQYSLTSPPKLTVNGVISSIGPITLGLKMAGTSTLTIAGTNTYTGSTSLESLAPGPNTILAVGNDSAFSTTTVTLHNALVMTAVGGARTIANAVFWDNNGTIAGSNDFTLSGSFIVGPNAITPTLTVNNSGMTTLSGPVFLAPDDINAHTLVYAGSGTTEISGVITNNPGANTKGSNLQLNSTTGGTLILSGTNTYTGVTTLTKGTLILGNKVAFGTSDVTWSGVTTSASINLSGPNAVLNRNTIAATDNVFTGSNSLTLSGTTTSRVASNTITNNMSSGTTFTLAGTYNISDDSTARTTTFSGSGNTVISGVVADGGGSPGNLTMSGTGTLTLRNANTYSGTTMVSAGTLVANNATGSATGPGAVIVNAGTLGGKGIISGAVTIGSGSGSGAFLAPSVASSQPTTFALRKTLSFKADSTYTYKLNTNNAQADLVVAKGVTIESGAQFNLQAIGNKKLSAGSVFTVINNSSITAITGGFANLPDGLIFTVGQNKFQASYSGGTGNDLTLTILP